MRKMFLIYQVVVPVVIIFLTTDCKKEEPAKLAELSTIPVKNFTTVAAVSGGKISSDGGSEILSNGVCWSTSVNPEITDSKTVEAVGLTTPFRSSLSGLTPGTAYHVRAYATNSVDAAYGDDVKFTTYSGSVSDAEGNDYYTTAIGVQVWMASNLNATRYSNGDFIGTTIPEYRDITDDSSPKYQWAPDADEVNVADYGRLYTWDAVTDSRNVCPTGWHVPTDAEWNQLTTFLGGESIAGGKLKETGRTHWLVTTSGATNETSFTALPGGSQEFQIYEGMYFSGLGHRGFWWSSTENTSEDAFYWSIHSENNAVFRNAYNKRNGYSVRCLLD
jgi:uncharacterized protein (TIGR02145 family)